MDCPLRHRFARSHFNDAPIFYICSQEYIHSLHHHPSVTPVFYHYLYHHVSGHQPRIRRKMISTVWRQRRHYKKSVYQKKNIFWRKDKKGWDFIQCLKHCPLFPLNSPQPDQFDGSSSEVSEGDTKGETQVATHLGFSSQYIHVVTKNTKVCFKKWIWAQCWTSASRLSRG